MSLSAVDADDGERERDRGEDAMSSMLKRRAARGREHFRIVYPSNVSFLSRPHLARTAGETFGVAS